MNYELVGYDFTVATDQSVALTTSTARLLLAGFDEPGSRAELVAQRLGQAIRLGVLIDGERLPTEAQLAGQMGVSPATLREALSVLRGQGLVVTRRGRNGGTFVRSPTTGSEPIMDFGIHELQEMGDQRSAVIGAAAALAAERALAEDVLRLDEQVELLATASTPSDRWRGDTQLLIRIAAAAQSSRLTREVARLRAEMGDLVGLGSDGDEHQGNVAERRRLVEAIRDRRAADARALAEKWVATETEALIRLRIQSVEIAAGVPAGDIAGAFEETIVILETVIGELHTLVGRLGQLHEADGRSLVVDDLAALRPTILSIIEAHEGLVIGAGLVAGPDLLADAEHWLEWWSTPGAPAKPEPLRVNLEPDAQNFFNYANTSWFASAAETREPLLSGPYVDHECTNLYTATLSAPILLEDEFRGVAAADLSLARLEALLMPSLRALPTEAALVTTEGRVIASSDPAMISAGRLPRSAADNPRHRLRAPLDTLEVVEL